MALKTCCLNFTASVRRSCS